MNFKTLSQELDEIIKTAKDNNIELLGSDIASIIGSLVTAQTMPNMAGMVQSIVEQNRHTVKNSEIPNM